MIFQVKKNRSYSGLKKSIFLLCLFLTPLYGQRVIGLMQVRDEEKIIENSLRVLALHTDAIIVLDDGSVDTTVEIINRLKEELNIIEVIVNAQSQWLYGSEVTNRQKLLDAGRQNGGTHFIEIDADEVFTTHCAQDNWLKNKILSLERGQILQIPLINLWKSFDHYRSTFNDSFPDICYVTIGYCDDGVSDLSYNLHSSFSTFLHFGRFPHKQPEHYPLFVYESDINKSLIHLPFINWTNIIIKKIWMIMLEIIRLQENIYNREKFPEGRTVQDICNFYESYHNYDQTHIVLADTPTSWLDYSFFNKEPYKGVVAHQKLQEIRNWLEIYEYEMFLQSNYIRRNLHTLLLRTKEN